VSTLPPRAVLVHRQTELTELMQRHGTRGQAEFFLRARGRQLAELEARHDEVASAIAAVVAAVPGAWRRARVERAELARFSFEPDDIVIVVGQDGLVANVAKYLDGQPVVGINAEPGRNPGVLVRHLPAAAAGLLADAAGPPGQLSCDQLSMVQADADDGQRLVALNEVYLGHATHQSARYLLATAAGPAESQTSSGILVGSGTGATGWSRSAWLERHSQLSLPGPAERRLTWFVREAWPSPVTGTTATEGELGPGELLSVTVSTDQLVLFGDGIDADSIPLTWGQSVTIGLASRILRLAGPPARETRT
jgi:NAD kinase